MLPSLVLATLMACPPVATRVMVFNIEYGGGLVDFARTLEAMRRAAPDIVLVEEAWGQMPRLAHALGFPEHDARHQVLSRYPLLDPGNADGRYLYAELRPGCGVALANVHLPSDPEPPEELPDDAALEAAMAVETRVRLRALQPTLDAVRPRLDDGMPVLLGGDFNAPSHLDDPHPWPASLALARAGLRDVWREAHPNARDDPGFTWWAARPPVAGWNPSPRARQVRIDQLHAGGPVTVKGVQVVGEAGREGVAIGITPWPSDHRAIVAALEIGPAPLPSLVTAWPLRVAQGEEVRVRARGFPEGSRLVGPARAGEGATAPSRDAGPADAWYPTAALAIGAHEVALHNGDGATLATATFWVKARDARPRVEVERDRVPVGHPIAVRWTDAPGERWDWVGIYTEGVSPEPETEALLWQHTGAEVAGRMRLDARVEGGSWPLPPGRYRVYLFEDDAYSPLAEAPLVVVP